MAFESLRDRLEEQRATRAARRTAKRAKKAGEKASMIGRKTARGADRAIGAFESGLDKLDESTGEGPDFGFGGAPPESGIKEPDLGIDVGPPDDDFF